MYLFVVTICCFGDYRSYELTAIWWGFEWLPSADSRSSIAMYHTTVCVCHVISGSDTNISVVSPRLWVPLIWLWGPCTTFTLLDRDDKPVGNRPLLFKLHSLHSHSVMKHSFAVKLSLMIKTMFCVHKMLLQKLIQVASSSKVGLHRSLAMHSSEFVSLTVPKGNQSMQWRNFRYCDWLLYSFSIQQACLCASISVCTLRR